MYSMNRSCPAHPTVVLVLAFALCSIRKKDGFNNTCGGAAAGLSVALLSRHTRTPQMVAAHVVGAAAITSVVAVGSKLGLGSTTSEP